MNAKNEPKMIDYTAEQLQELEQLKVTEQEIEILKRISIGTLPPSNLGRDDMILFQLTAYRDYELYFIKKQRLERLSYNSARNFMANMGFNKRYFEDLHVLMMKKVFDPDQPKWRLDNNIWLYNEYQKSEYSAIYQFYRDYGKKKGINKNSTKELKLPPLHRELFNNVFNDELSIEYMAVKVKRLLSGIKKSNTYTILRGIGGSGKSLLKALKPRYQKIALFSPISRECEGLGECESLNSLEFHSAISKQKALELVSTTQEELLFETILKRYDELQTTHDFVIGLGYTPKFFLNALLDLNTILAKHLNAPIVAVAQTSLESLKAMHSHILKKEAPFAVGLLTGEMLEKTTFFERVSLQATMRIRSRSDRKRVANKKRDHHPFSLSNEFGKKG